MEAHPEKDGADGPCLSGGQTTLEGWLCLKAGHVTGKGVFRGQLQRRGGEVMRGSPQKLEQPDVVAHTWKPEAGRSKALACLKLLDETLSQYKQ